MGSPSTDPEQAPDPVRNRGRRSARYAAAGVNFVLMWAMVALVVGIVVHMIFPHPDPSGSAGPESPGLLRGFLELVLDWRNLPGVLLGLILAVRSARASLRNSG